MQIADLKNKKIIVGITGGIAAYKSLSLIRLLVRSGAEVQVIMTATANDFVTPLTASTLSKRPVLQEFTANEVEGTWNNHVHWGMWADALIVAPATAHTLSAMAHGQCDNFLLAVYLSARCPVIVAPAMDVDMWSHPATRRNLDQLRTDGISVVPPGTGELASGLSGTGRMAEPEDILHAIEPIVTDPSPIISKLHVLVTAGPTYESLDPVRFIGNWSTGKMGIAIAEQFFLQGAQVTLVQGPGTQEVRFADINTIRVRSAEEMDEACRAVWSDCQIGVFAAAVADYKPAQFSDQKISKKDDDLNLVLERTPDIAAGLGKKKRKDQMMIGFAMETQNEINNARNKLDKKNLDLIVLNSLNETGSGFGTDTNKVTFISRQSSPDPKPLKTKMEVAKDIVKYVENNFTI